MGTVMLQAPVLFKNIQRSNIRVAQTCIQVPYGGAGSSVTGRTARRVFPWQQDTEDTV